MTVYMLARLFRDGPGAPGEPDVAFLAFEAGGRRDLRLLRRLYMAAVCVVGTGVEAQQLCDVRILSYMPLYFELDRLIEFAPTDKGWPQGAHRLAEQALDGDDSAVPVPPQVGMALHEFLQSDAAKPLLPKLDPDELMDGSKRGVCFTASMGDDCRISTEPIEWSRLRPLLEGIP